MGKFLFFVVAAVACFIAAESLSCNQCGFSLFGVCISKSNVTCGTNTSVCYTGTTTFPSLPSLSTFTGFSNQGCRENSTCTNSTGSLLNVNYTTTITCCSTDRCNPISINAAPSTKMSFTAAVGVALLASILGSFL